jgi:hypothetical protein
MKYIHFESFKASDLCNHTCVFGIPRIQNTHTNECVPVNVSSSDGGTTLKCVASQEYKNTYK